MKVDEIIARAGGVMKLAEIAGADHSTVCGWRRKEKIPVGRALIIHEKLLIALHEIRPDVWRDTSERAA
jgi:hypothetical protein